MKLVFFESRYLVSVQKSGLRVSVAVYYYLTADHQIWLFTIYGKDEAADLSPAEKRMLRKAIQAELAVRGRNDDQEARIIR